MGKQSRRQRKLLRGRRDRAVIHGLPVGQVPQPKLPLAAPAIATMAAGASGTGSQPPRDSASVSPDQRHGWSTWPWSIKLLLIGILGLVAIGLFRRYTESGSEGHAESLGRGQASTGVGPGAGSGWMPAPETGVPAQSASGASATPADPPN